uniref:Uncharacterized protein LOC105648935 n=1 Tax=Rhizophora mucronata TaxID=61149 RepID=A0A2P2KKB4_RHIMU
MGTREVYEEQLRSGHLHHDPTLNPGLGCPRCPRCLALLNPNSGKGEWTITSVLHDAAAVAGSGIGGMLSAVHGFNTGIPFLQNRLKGPKWLPFVVGVHLLNSSVFSLCIFTSIGLPPVELHRNLHKLISCNVLTCWQLPPLLVVSGASAAFGAAGWTDHSWQMSTSLEVFQDICSQSLLNSL